MRISLESSAWALVKTAALAIFIVQMIHALQKYLDNPMVSSVTYKNLTLADLPSIMICAQEQKNIQESINMGYEGCMR